MSQILTKEQFDKLTKDLPEDGFTTLLPLLMESFGKKRGRTLDRTQVASLCVGLMEMSATIDAQVTMIGQMQKEMQEWENTQNQQKSSRIWTPKK